MKTLFYRSILLFLSSISLLVHSQQLKIVTLLNKELAKETKTQKENPGDYYSEKFEVVKKFSLENTMLSLEIMRNDNYTEKQEVDFRKIKRIAKDLNVIFETEPDAVKITETSNKGEKTVRRSSMFFLKLSHEKQNEKLANQLVKAFKKVGLKIEREFGQIKREIIFKTNK